MSQPHAEDGDPPAGELRLLGEVSWCGSPVHGGRTHALLAALVQAHGSEVVGGAPKMHRRKAGGGGS